MRILFWKKWARTQVHQVVDMSDPTAVTVHFKLMRSVSITTRQSCCPEQPCELLRPFLAGQRHMAVPAAQQLPQLQQVQSHASMQKCGKQSPRDTPQALIFLILSCILHQLRSHPFTAAPM
mgnify:CR=1 FL=1